MAPRLIVHAGSHKTGTTALQRHFSAHREELRRAGLHYPDPSPEFGGQSANHVPVVAALVRGNDDDRARIAAFAARLAEAPERHILLSAETLYRLAADGVSHKEEGFWPARARLLERLRESFAGFDLSYLLVLRRPDRLAEAHYAETIAATEAAPSFADHLGQKPYRYQYRRQMDLFAASGPTSVLCYEAAVQQGLVSSISAAIDLPLIGEPPASVRPSVGVRAQCWLREAKLGEGARPRRDRRWRFALERGDLAPFDGPPVSLWPGQEARAAFVSAALADVESPAFSPVPAPEPPPVTWDAAAQARAEAAFAEWEAQNEPRLAARDAAGLRPFEPDLAPSQEP
ncbi:hypothetical protein [Pseudoroseicyclus tamaricis]|uniref:Sulfotransferase family protein n=1 Tax=Pseudoroseicyclus tamaricis TaxID=2705421 RepID=A0A6B2JI43_9RHOB|nr:hypothetical protein [Pseudoroseicyclus tamaricis]NDV01013.1 hypothetical protein [Pseudoroseicyclus tamaricis]